MYLLVSICMFHANIQLVVQLDVPPRACALPGDTHAEQVTFQVNVYSWSTVYCHSPSKIVGVSMICSFARAPESASDCTEGHQARLCEGGDSTVSFTRKPDLVDPVEVPNSPYSHRMTISSVLRRSMLVAREREAGNEADSRTYRGPAYVARSAGCTAGKRGP